ncbi:MAG: SOS response-associated peptidase [Alphaproteobacteria bacterium]|nr:SOS response-associated peptidase [Alphaproteobacteria bacterium]
MEGSPANLPPRYNLAPSQDAAVVRSENGERRLSLLRWGLIPPWAKDVNIGHRLINARAETAAVKPAFRAAFAKRRCLVPADGFYEWQREGVVRQPWLITRRDGTPMVFAGLWERWQVPEVVALRGSLAECGPGEIVETFTLLTTEANATLRSLHHRMPVILTLEAFGPWLAGAAIRLRPAPDDWLTMHRVGLWANNPRNDDPECIAPLASA